MLFVIECVIACIIFAAIILPTQYKNPIKYIIDYSGQLAHALKRVQRMGSAV